MSKLFISLGKLLLNSKYLLDFGCLNPRWCACKACLLKFFNIKYLLKVSLSLPNWFILLFPVLLNSVGNNVFHGAIDATIISSIEHVIFGLLMIVFMIYEPLGMAKLWENIKQKVKTKFVSSNIKSKNT